MYITKTHNMKVQYYPTDCVARYSTRGRYFASSNHSGNYNVLSDTEWAPRAVSVSRDVLNRSEAFSHPTADTRDDVETNLETPTHDFIISETITVFDLISGLFAYVNLGKKNTIISEPPWTFFLGK